MRIEEIMTRDVGVVRAEAPAAEAARIMWERDCGSVPVVDEDHFPVGMVTDRDLCMASYTRGLPLSQFRVGTAMSRAVRTCRTVDSLEDAERTMAEAQVRRLPVVGDFGHVVGIVSLTDIARARSSSPVQRAAEHLLNDVADTLVRITAPRARDSSLASA